MKQATKVWMKMASESLHSNDDLRFMRLAMRLARRGYGLTSPNPLVGAVLVRSGKVLGRGWHRAAGLPHAEIEAIADAERRGHSSSGATLYVTLEPCSTWGRTPPCTEAIVRAGIRRVVAAAQDPNPLHQGRGFLYLRGKGISVERGPLERECTQLNEIFNHWITQATPFVTVKAAMTLDGKIATAAGESKWITQEKSREVGMELRRGADAVLVGVNTVRADDPSLTVRPAFPRPIKRIVLDSMAATPLASRVLTDESAATTTVVATRRAPASRVRALKRRVRVWLAPQAQDGVQLQWVLKKLADEGVTSLLVEGGGEINASFLTGKLVQRIAFFYAPKILGGVSARKAVAGARTIDLSSALRLEDVQWRRLDDDLMLTARIMKGDR